MRDGVGVAYCTGHVCGNHCMHTRTDERKEVGGQEVKNKRNASSDLSDGYRLT